MVRYNKRKYYEKLPCKYDPSNAGIGCMQPRMCSICGWNPRVKSQRDAKIHQKLKEAMCNG